MSRLWNLSTTAFVYGLLVSTAAIAQMAGPNVNMVSGTKWPGGDPNLQKQNEPSIAVSTRNPLHLVAGANDYRTVDFAGLPFADEEGVNHDAWLGLFKSYDGGVSWQSTLLPGCSFTPKPGEPNPCAGSPLAGSGKSAGADPTVRAGTSGLFYYSFIAFDRTNKKNGAVAVARVIDDNNRESPVLDESNGNGGANAGKDPIRYLDTSIVDSNSGGQFSDKPFLAVDIPRAGAAQCAIPGTATQTIPAGNVYVAYSIFVGNDQNIRSKIMFAASSDCGRTWRVQKLSESSSVNQGAAVAIDPGTGTVYVAWRRFKNLGGSGQVLESDNILVVKSVDSGQSFTKYVEVIPGGAVQPFDIGTRPSASCPNCGPQFRTNALPTMAIVPGGTAYIAWAQRIGGGESRIVMSSSGDGVNWSQPLPVEGPVQAPYATSQAYAAAGHQFMPALSYAGGKLMLLFYDLREDHTMGLFTPMAGNMYSEGRSPMQHPTKGWDPAAAVFGAGASPSDGGLALRHTIDVRLIQKTPPLVTGLSSVRVSQYHFGATVLNGPIRQLQMNPPNLKLFRKGQAPFIGDFVDIAAVPFVPDGAGGWKFNTDSSNSIVFHAAWTDNRNVRPTSDINKYAPPGSTGGISRFDPTQTAAACTTNFSQPGAMNQDIYTARIDQGIVTGALTNAKPLNIDRAFSFFVRNTGAANKYFNLSLDNQPSGAVVSFKPTGSLTNLCVAVGARSGISRVVFAKPNANTKAGIRIAVQEVSACPGGMPVPGGLQSTILLNSDAQNPEIENSLAPEVFNPEIENPEIENPEIENPEIENPEIENPEIENPEIENPEIENPEIENPEIENPEIENPEIENPEIENVPPGSKITDVSWKVRNNGSATSTYNPKLLLNGRVPTGVKTQLVVHKFYNTNTSKTGVCTLLKRYQTVTLVNIPSPKFYSSGDANLTNPEIENGALDNATFSLAKGEVARITVRVLGAVSFDAGTFFTTNTKPVVVSLPPNPGGVNPIALVMTTMSLPDGVTGTPYNQPVTSVGGTGPYAWSLLPGAPAWLTITGTGSTATLAGTSPSAGTYTVPVKVNDAASRSNSQMLTLRIAEPLAITTTALNDAISPTPYWQALGASGGTGARTWSIIAGALPSPLTLNPSTGLIRGMAPAAGTPVATFTVQATDSGSPAQTATRVLSIRTVERLYITTAVLPDAVAATPYSAALAATGGVGPWVWSVQGTPAFPTINPANGQLSGTAPLAGTYPRTFIVTDSTVPPQTATVTLNIRVFDPLVITTAALNDAVSRGTPYSATLAATGGTGTRTWSISSGSLPAWATLNPATGQISGTPPLNTTGTDNFTVLLTDSASPPQTATRSLAIRTVAPLRIPPTFIPDTVTGAAYSATLAATGGVLPVTWSVDGAPAFPTVNPATGQLSGTAPSPGTYPRTFIVTDSTVPPQSVALSVNMRVAAPLTITTPSPLPSGVVGAAYSQTLAASGGIGPLIWTWSAAPGYTMPPGLDSNAAGVVFGTPSTVGTFGFQMTVRDSSSPTQLIATKICGIQVMSPPSANITFITQPIDSVFGGLLLPVLLVVEVRDGTGAVLPGVNVTMTLGSQAAPGGAALAGTTTKLTDALGRATFDDLMIRGSNSGTGFNLIASVGPIWQGSNFFAVTNFPAPMTMGAARTAHTATLLLDGRVLISSGASAEIFNPATGTFAPVSGFGADRRFHTATRVITPGNRSQVLIAGGGVAPAYLATNDCRLYDPLIDTYTSCGTLLYGRYGHTATLLNDGRVLFVGGNDPSGTVELRAETYDPLTGVHAPAGTLLLAPHVFHTATLLTDGRVVIIGGATTLVQIWNAGAFSGVPGISLNVGSGATATLLSNGTILVASVAVTGGARIYDPVTNTLSTPPAMVALRVWHTATRLSTGNKVLFTGGTTGAVTGVHSEIYDPATGTFTAVYGPSVERDRHTATLLSSGQVLITGGTVGGSPSAIADLFVP